MGLKPTMYPYSAFLQPQRSITSSELRQLLEVITDSSEKIQSVEANAKWKTGERGTADTADDVLTVEQPESLVSLDVTIKYDDRSVLGLSLEPKTPSIIGTSGLALERARRVEILYKAFPRRGAWFTVVTWLFIGLVSVAVFTLAASFRPNAFPDPAVIGVFVFVLLFSFLSTSGTYGSRLHPASRHPIVPETSPPLYKDRAAMLSILVLLVAVASAAIAAYVAFWKDINP